MVQTSLIYVFVFFLTTKTFSSPFHIWYVPLLAIYPFSNAKKQLQVLFLAMIMILLDTTPWIKVANVSCLGPIMCTRVRDLFRFLPMFVLGVIFCKEFFESFQLKQVKQKHE
jgi:hypothetical protein